MEDELEFRPWPKIPRGLKESIVITEKMDGSNACVVIREGAIIAVQSRKRFITPGKDTDNYGFAGWVERNTEELLKMGDGHHYGEWVGLGIAKNPHDFDAKYFYLFNTARWNSDNPNKPLCCSVVPVLYEGENTPEVVEETMADLLFNATAAGTKAEGVVVWYSKGRRLEKHTFKWKHGKWSME